MNVEETGSWKGEVAKGNDCVVRNHGVLAGIALHYGRAWDLRMRSCVPGRIFQGHGKHTWMGSGGCFRF
jgi:hypothetical protein